MLSVLTHTLHRRRISLLWWSLAVAGMAALLAVAYPTVRDNNDLDKTFADLPPGVATLLGLSGGNLLTSPAGYLDSQFFANIYPVLLLVLAIGLAAWSIAGDENAGTLELLLANPISRAAVALSRFVTLVLILTWLTVVCFLTLVLLAPSTGLDEGLSTGHLIAATAAAGLLALSFAATAFAVGAATGNRPGALSIAAGLAVTGYVLEGLAAQVHVLSPTRAANPWHWLLADDPLRHGLTWQTWLPPLATTSILVLVGVAALAHRDLH